MNGVIERFVTLKEQQTERKDSIDSAGHQLRNECQFGFDVILGCSHYPKLVCVFVGDVVAIASGVLHIMSTGGRREGEMKYTFWGEVRSGGGIKCMASGQKFASRSRYE